MTTATADPVGAVLGRLDNVKQTGPKQWIARCPVHDDKHASLSITHDDEGKVALFCHAGCSTKDVCAAVGIELRDLFPPKVNNKPAAKTKGRITDTYDYADADGKLLYQVCRYAPKDFRQRRPDGSGGWIWNLNGTARVLFRLPELLKADKSAWVFVSEGEKDADALTALGLVATCNPGGAGKWHKLSDDSPLHGRRVAILPDKDGPGRKHAQQVAKSLQGKANEIRIIDLPGNGKDVTDFIEAIPGASPDDTRGDLLALADAAPVYEPPAEPEPLADKTDTPPKPGGAVIVCLADVKAEPLRWLWPGRFPLGKVSLIAGDPGLGKSLLTLDLAARVSRGLPWPDTLGEPTEPGSIVLLSAEDDIADTIRPRLDAAGADVNSIRALQGVLYTESNTGTTREAAFSLQHDLPALQEAITRTGNARLVIIDPITAYLGGTDSHKNAEIRGLLAPLAQLAAKHKVAIIAITHLNKNASGSAMYRAMGSLAFAAAARAYWAVTKDKENPARRLFLPVKCNLSAGGSGLAYSVLPTQDDPGIPIIAWEPDPVVIEADEALTQEPGQSDHGALGEAVDWLRGVLSAGSMKAKDIKKRAKDDGIAARTLDRAKSVLKVKAKCDGYQGPWIWSLPP
ncbi:MAG: AAA family ATPase [Phycisphaerae bacterium]|nr:AAA family ATPase [Phycisphaerae bacterium]